MSFRNFEEFYPFYLGEHAERTSRRLHVIGTSAAVLQLLAAVVTGEPLLFFIGVGDGLRICLGRSLRVREESACDLQTSPLQSAR